MFSWKDDEFFLFIGIECHLLMSDVTNLNMCI